MARKAKLPKGIILRKDGQYCARFQVKGKRYVLYGTDVESLAEEMQTKKAEVENGTYRADNKVITLDSWFDTWITLYKSELKIDTVQSYRQTYTNHISPVLGKYKLKEINDDAITAFFKNLDEDIKKNDGKGYSHINKIKAIFLGMFDDAVRHKNMAVNPMNTAVFPTSKKVKGQRKIKAMSQEQLDLFMSYAAKSECEYYDVLQLLSMTGLRIGEALALRWTDIDFKNQCMWVNGTLIYPKLHDEGMKGKRFIDTPKTQSSHRRISFKGWPEIELMLRRRKKNQSRNRLELGQDWKEEAGLENLVFTYPTGGAYWDTCIRVEMNKILAEIAADGIEFPHVTPHSFRHSYASIRIQKGYNSKQIQKNLGHSSFMTTMDIYADVFIDGQDEEDSKFREALKVSRVV